MILKEKRNPTPCDNNSSVWKADSLNLGSKGIHQLNLSESDASHLTFEVKGGDIYPDPKGVDDSSMDNDFKVGDSCRKGNLNELSDHASDQDICISSLDLFETMTNPRPDKSALQSDLHALTITQDHINLQVVKDICMDSGVQMEYKFPISFDEDDNENHKTSGEGIAMKFPISGGLKESLETTKGVDDVQYESKQESLIAEERLKLLPESSCDKDIHRKSDLEGVDRQIDETNCGPISKTVTGGSEVVSIVDRTLGQTLSTLESEEKNVKQLVDQEASEVGTCVSLGELLEREPKEDKHASSILYDSKVESGSITFNFDSLAASSEQCEDDKNNLTATDNLLDSGQVDWSNSKDTNNNNKTAETEANSANTFDDDKYDDVGIESSFAAAGLIPNPASLSFRSEGSTGSTKSFAFPILQSEWNSSPVRMAKADRRDFRKRRGWRSGLLCCRF